MTRADVIDALIQKLPEHDRSRVIVALPKLPDDMLPEFTILMGQKKTVLEIRDFLSGEFEPLPLADPTDYFQAHEKLGLLRMVARIEAPATPQTRKRD